MVQWTAAPEWPVSGLMEPAVKMAIVLSRLCSSGKLEASMGAQLCIGGVVVWVIGGQVDS